MKATEFDIKKIKECYPTLYGILNDYYGLESKAKYDVSKLIIEKIGNSKNYTSYWKENVLKTISKEIDFDVNGITFGFVPNYGGQVRISNVVDRDKIGIVEIQFYVSLLEGVYTMQILESEESIEYHPLLKRKLPSQTLREIWVSPENHKYESIFLKIQSVLEGIIETPMFLPFSIQQIELEGVKPPSMEDKIRYDIGDAFFRKILPLERENAVIKGNPDYFISKLV